MTEKLDQKTLESTVRFLTAIGDAWGGTDRHPIYVLRDGIPPGLIAPDVRIRNQRITVVLSMIMEHTGRIVTDDVIDQIIAFVDGTADNDDYND